MRNAPKPADQLNPVFHIGRKDYVMVTQSIAAVQVTLLNPPVVSLSQHRDEIMSAMVMLTHGF